MPILLVVGLVNTLLVLATSVYAVTVCSTPSITIPNNDSTGISDTLTLNDHGKLYDLNVNLDVSHTHVGELIVSLTHDDTGTDVMLIEQPGIPEARIGCTGHNIVNLTIDDEGSYS
ncbi:MAG: hypothetical protein DRR19_29160, partial [Candidatus Parabeggiatoa sp. nov. 1]